MIRKLQVTSYKSPLRSVQAQHIDRLQGLFDALKDEFVYEYNKYCAGVIGVLSVTASAPSRHLESHPSRHLESHSPFKSYT